MPSLPLAFAIARFFDLTVDKMFDPGDEEAGTC
jgi:DNA-binding XRE family transcriptional regulator